MKTSQCLSLYANFSFAIAIGIYLAAIFMGREPRLGCSALAAIFFMLASIRTRMDETKEIEEDDRG
jgi:hypothetical protein